MRRNVTGSLHTAYGVSWAQITKDAIEWWDFGARFIVDNSGINNKEDAVKSGILRGLPFAELTRKEATNVVLSYESHKIRPIFAEQIAENAHKADQNELDPLRLKIYEGRAGTEKKSQEALSNDGIEPDRL